MSSILGHGLAGMTVWALARRHPALRSMEHKGWLAAAAAGGCLPDIDSLIGLSHRGPTHTLGFAVAASALLAAAVAATGRRREAIGLLPTFTLIVWLHPMMDLLNGGGPSVALFAPLWFRSFAPVAGGLPLHGYTHEWSDLGHLLLEPRTLGGMLVETLIFLPLFGAAIGRHRPLQIGLGLFGVVAWSAFAFMANHAIR